QAGALSTTNNSRLYIANSSSSALVHGDFSTGKVMINATGMTNNATSAPAINAALDIRTQSATDRGLVVRLASDGTANAFEVQKNNGDVIFSIASDGNLGAIRGVNYVWPTSGPAEAGVGQLGTGILEGARTGASEVTLTWRQFKLVTAAALDFPNTAPQATSDLDVTIQGADPGDVVMLGTPAPAANSTYTAWVSAANTVTVRLHNYAAGGGADVDPAAADFKITVIK
ncbi:MAG TPA: hypothetical protein DCZ59_02825, partial [Bacteroidetes bacterium]|nr:hypothetical protein [Bacteroidota bacterium]